MVRNIFFQVHLWTGLVLGLVLAVIGLTGSLLVYQKEFIALGQKPLPRAETQGTPLSADALIAAGKAAVPGRTDSVTLVMAQAPGEAAAVFLRKVSSRSGDAAGNGGERRHARGEGRGMREPQMRGGGRREGQGPEGRGGEGGRRPYTYVYLDPVTGKVLEVRETKLNPFFAMMHQLHGNLMLGREGRQVVGWLGVIMLALGLSGIYLWWPRRGAWKYAFGIRKKAKGYLFHRDLHGAAGIWLWAVFIIVSFTGVAISFPATFRPVMSAQSQNFDPRRGPVIEPVAGVDPIGADAAIALVQAEIPGAAVATLALPSKPEDAMRITVAGDGPAATAYIDPYAKKIAGWRNKPADLFAWQRPLHEGEGWGAIWRALVFVSGLLPLLFVITGTIMWLKKRKGKAGAKLRVVEAV